METENEEETSSNGGLEREEIQAVLSVREAAPLNCENVVTHHEETFHQNNFLNNRRHECNILGGEFTNARFGPDNRTTTISNKFKIKQFFYFSDRPSHQNENEDIPLSGQISLCKSERLNPLSESESKIYRGFCKSGVLPRRSSAIKITPLSTNVDELQNQHRQLETLSKLNHENVVRLFAADIFEENLKKYMAMAMELCDELPLFNVVTSLEPIGREIGLSYTHQLSEGLCYIHSKEKIHGDLTPHNILLSTTCQKTAIKITSGFKWKEEHFTMSSDVYSLGMSIFFIWSSGKRPLGRDDAPWSHPKYQYPQRAFLQYLSHNDFKPGVSVLKKMLHSNPKVRPTAEYVKHDLRETFYSPAAIKLRVAARDVQRLPFQNSSSLPEAVDSLPGSSLGQHISAKALQLQTNARKPKDLMIFDRAYPRVIRYTPREHQIQYFEGWPESETDRFSSGSSGHFSAVSSEEWVYVFKGAELYSMRYTSRRPTWRKVKTDGLNHGSSPPVVAFQGLLYVLGGEKASGRYDKWTSTDVCMKYNRSMKGWEKLASMKTKRRSHAIVACQEFIYCIGGRNESSPQIRNVERFDPNNGRGGKWTTIKCPGVTLYHSSAAVNFNGKIYVIGGSDGRARVNKILQFDPAGDSWTDISQVPGHCMQRRACFRACVVNNRIYVVGGKDSLERDHRVVEAIELIKGKDDRIEAQSHPVQALDLDNIIVEGEATVALTF